MTTPQISVQLYSIHEELDADLDGSLAKLADTGLTTVEAFDFVRRADALKASFDRYGLSSPTAHAVLIEKEANTPDGLLTRPPAEEVFAAAQALGVQVVIDPYVPAEHWQTMEDVQRNADRLNEAAAKGAVPLSGHYSVSYGKDISGKFNMAPVEVAKDATKLVFSGMKGDFEYATSTKRGVFDVAADSLELSGPSDTSDITAKIGRAHV